MDPFSHFDLFRHRVDQMFNEFDQQMFGPDSDLWEAPLGLPSTQQPGHERQLQIKEGDKGNNSPSQPRSSTSETLLPHSKGSGSGSGSSERSLAKRPSKRMGLTGWGGLNSALSNVKLDLIEEKDRYLVNADMPGFSKDQIKLRIEDGMLTVSGEAKAEKEEHDESRKYHRIERSSGGISRSIRLPADIKEEQITATCENGVLQLVLPKEEVKPKAQRQITIQ